MVQKDDIWRNLVNSLPALDEGTPAPEMESIVPKRKAAKKFLVQKIVTEMYVWTDTQNHLFAEATFQDLYLLGEMTESKLNKLLKAEQKSRNEES